MTIVTQRPKNRKITIDLQGPEGNAFCLLGICRQVAKQLDIDFNPIKAEATSGDYDRLLKTLDDHFGAYIDFVK